MSGTNRNLPFLLNAFRPGIINGISAQDMEDVIATLRQGPPTFDARDFVPSGYSYGTLSGSNPTPLSSFFTSLAQAQAQYPFATALTNYLDRCGLQLALNTSTSMGGGVVAAPGGIAFLDAPLSWDGSLTALHGPSTANLTLATQTVGTSPALSVSGVASQQCCNVPLANINLQAFNAGITQFPQAGGGTPNSGYSTGTTALQIANLTEGVLAANVNFFNYDTPYGFAGTVSEISFINCSHNSNNKAPCIPAAVSRMAGIRWIGGTHANNNYNGYFVMTANGVSVSGSVFLDEATFGYGIVNQIFYDGLGSTNLCLCPLFVNSGHMESNNTTQGIAPRISNNGALFLNGVACVETGANPQGLVAPGVNSRTSIANCQAPGTGQDESSVPLVFTSGAPTRVAGFNNSLASGGDVLLLRSNQGDVLQGPAFPGEAIVVSGAYTLSLTDQAFPHNLTSGGGNLTMPPDSTTNHAIGSKVLFYTTGSQTWTFVQGAGVTINTVGTGLTFGGAPGKLVALIKTAANTWLAVGDMT